MREGEGAGEDLASEIELDVRGIPDRAHSTDARAYVRARECAQFLALVRTPPSHAIVFSVTRGRRRSLGDGLQQSQSFASAGSPTRRLPPTIDTIALRDEADRQERSKGDLPAQNSRSQKGKSSKIIP